MCPICCTTGDVFQIIAIRNFRSSVCRICRECRSGSHFHHIRTIDTVIWVIFVCSQRKNVWFIFSKVYVLITLYIIELCLFYLRHIYNQFESRIGNSRCDTGIILVFSILYISSVNDITTCLACISNFHITIS